jgi:hypothetical protein
MSQIIEKDEALNPGLDRRVWLKRTASRSVALAGIALVPRRAEATQERKLTPAQESDQELERARSKVRTATSHPLRTALSEEYQVVGDASESFMKTALADCGRIGEDFLAHYQAKGFQVKRPERRMTIVAFLDERPFFEFARKFAHNVPANASGFYSRGENWLVLYDIRNVPADELGGALKNVRTLAHEATHQLTFNTGLLNRRGDVPVSIIEGLGCYGETRRIRGRNEPGLLNSPRLDDLAHVQRRAKWMSTAELITDDAAASGANTDQMLLAYAQSWLLIYYLMNSPQRLPQLQEYLRTIFPRLDKKRRLEDAMKCFGDLDRLDQELRREAIRLQKEPRP